jgi:glutamate carboxypeptidase
MKSKRKFCFLQAAMALFVAAMVSESFAQPQEPALSLTRKEKPALLESLKALVSIETGSRDFEG